MMNIQKSLTFIALLIFIMALTVVMCGKAPIKKRSLMEGDGNRDVKDQKLRPSKRTFCNAFTGCQGKRSDVSVPIKDYDYVHDSAKEDSLDDITRDILAELFLQALQARNSVRYPLLKRQGYFGREKRATQTDDESFEKIEGHQGTKHE